MQAPSKESPVPTDTTDTPLDENKRRERDEPGTTGQDGAGDAGGSPADRGHGPTEGDRDQLSSRKTPYRPESEDARKLPT